MPLHILGHIKADHGVLIAEHRLCQRFAQLRLADACGAEEQEGTDGPFRVFQPHAAAADRLCNRAALPRPARSTRSWSRILHVQKLLRLRLPSACVTGTPCPIRYHRRQCHLRSLRPLLCSHLFLPIDPAHFFHMLFIISCSMSRDLGSLFKVLLRSTASSFSPTQTLESSFSSSFKSGVGVNILRSAPWKPPRPSGRWPYPAGNGR